MFSRLSLSCQIPHLDEIYQHYFAGVSRGTFVEVGANDGYSWSNTWGLAELGWRGLYFEPVEALAIQCRDKHIHNNIKVVASAVGSHDGVTALFLGEGATTSRKVAEENTYFYGNNPDIFIPVPVVTLNTALNQEGIPHNFDLLVIDVDGDEVAVLEGIDLTIWKPKVIIAETCKEHCIMGWRFNAVGVDLCLRELYEEVYHDHINSIYVRRSPDTTEELPMPSLADLKRDALIGYAKKYGLKNFVETGTLFGDMVAELIPYFDYLFSVELHDGFYRSAVERFKHVPNVIIFHGDSGQVLADILPSIEGPTLYFLDAHFCGGNSVQGSSETPVLEELRVILSRPILNGIIVIDDLKNFKGNPAYPKPDEVLRYALEIHPELIVEETQDGEGMILIVPSKKERAQAKKLPYRAPSLVKDIPTAREVMEPRAFQSMIRNRPEIQSEGRAGKGPEIPEITWPAHHVHYQAVNQNKQSGRRR